MSRSIAYLIGSGAQLEHARELSDGAQLHEAVVVHRPTQIDIVHEVLWTEVVLAAQTTTRKETTAETLRLAHDNDDGGEAMIMMMVERRW